MKFILLIALSLSFSLQAFAQGNDENRVEVVKSKIIELARKYEDLAHFNQEGDEDLSKQESLEVFVNELIELKPQPPVSERLNLVSGVWRQIWGPYNYRGPERIVPDGIYVKEIYQAVFKDGYYYNVTPRMFLGRFEYVSLLRGEYILSESNSNGLDVEFTGFRFNRVRPNDLPIWELAALAENSNLPQPLNIVPDFLIQNTFQGGTLVEVYTDKNLRILYGTNSDDFNIPAIYVMEKISNL